jgi:hypothetical protein
MRITEYKNYDFLLGAAAGGAVILVISMYELAGLWGAIAALSAILIFLGLRPNPTRERQREAIAQDGPVSDKSIAELYGELKRFEEES